MTIEPTVLERKLEKLGKEYNLEDEWVTKYRVARITDLHTSYYLIAALVDPEDSDSPYANIWGFQHPTDADAELLGKYIDYKIRSWFRESYIKQMKEMPLDIDSGWNTTTIAKMEHSWVYRKMTWEGQPYSPTKYPKVEASYPTLLALLDHIERNWGSNINQPNQKWTDYKNKHGIA